ncbi:histidine phosphatase family protein [Robbsia andropogonis]|uniref:histidine phosphatase family protein n=1 Tax=Robbsia andropogonis TaxID=28092 RepID=UPI003D22B5A9
MARAILMMAHASTPAMRKGAFPERDNEAAALLALRTGSAGDALDQRAIEELTATRTSRNFVALTDTYVRVCCAPSRIAVASAYGLGFASDQITLDTGLATPHHGSWAGASTLQIGLDNPVALQAWTRDPFFAPPGGESFNAVCRRVTIWLATVMKDDSDQAGDDDEALPVLAIASAPVIRAAVLLARRAPIETFFQLNVAPAALFTL